MSLLFSSLVGETQCGIFFIVTTTNVRLTNLDPPRYIPMMISRMIISLKKVATTRQTYMGMDAANVLPTHECNSHTPHRVERETFPLSTFGE